MKEKKRKVNGKIGERKGGGCTPILIIFCCYNKKCMTDKSKISLPPHLYSDRFVSRKETWGRSRVNARLALCINISETVRDTSKVTISD